MRTDILEHKEEILEYDALTALLAQEAEEKTAAEKLEKKKGKGKGKGKRTRKLRIKA